MNMSDEEKHPRSSRESGDISAHLTWIERFVEKYWKTMPAAVRIPLFVLFCLLLIYGIYRPIGGEFSVRGVLLQQSADSRQPPVFASDHEVVVRDRHYGVNSVGEYYCIFGSKDYARLLFTGKRKIEVINRETNVPQFPEVEFSRIDQEFEVFALPAATAQPLPVGQALPETVPLAPSGSLIPVVWAHPAAAPRINFALVLTAVGFSPKTGARTGRFFLRLQDNTTLPLLSDKAGGAATYFPVVPGQKVRLPSLYYFSVLLPEQGDTEIAGEIVFEAEGGFAQFFKANQETFSFRLPRQPGREATLRGSLGSEMDVLLVSPYRVILFDKADIARDKDALQAELLRKGFFSMGRDSPLGTGAQTNALFGGKQVPFQALQSVLAILRTHSIRAKTVQYQLDLKSRDPIQIQVGGWAAFDERSPIPKEALDAILAAKTDDEFRAAVRPYAAPASRPRGARSPVRKRTP
jgi:hypothetical protein